MGIQSLTHARADQKNGMQSSLLLQRLPKTVQRSLSALINKNGKEWIFIKEMIKSKIRATVADDKQAWEQIIAREKKYFDT